jgi:anthranilate phosphoribosyltransferase
MKTILNQLLDKQDLTHLEMWEIFSKMMKGDLSEAQIAAFLVALRAKEESIEEIFTAVEIMKSYATPIKIKDKNALDTCGTGGAKHKTFNVSTTVAFVLAAAGVTVAKHGNRSNSGRSGSSDVLQALGVNIQLPPAETQTKINTNGIGFLFAPLYHPAMKYVMPVRKELSIRTIFNLLGPLANPAGVTRQLIGVFKEDLIKKYIYVLQKLGHQKAIVVHGQGGFDEFSLTGPSKYALLDKGKITIQSLKLSSVNLSPVDIKELQGGSPEENAQITQNILKG